MLSDPDYFTTISIIFVVEDFKPVTARSILLSDEWLMSLSAAPSDELFALQATTRIWRFTDAGWSQADVSEDSLRRIWAKHPDGPIAVGGNGVAYRLRGDTWQPIPPVAQVQYFDAHGGPRQGVFACGDQGTLHRLDAAGWQMLELHRHDQFRGLDVAPDGTIRLAGDGGVCLRVADEEVNELAGSDATYFAVRSFKGHVYWGDEMQVYVEKADTLEPFKDTGIGLDFRADSNYLYVAGVDTAWRFDGNTWKSLTLVYDTAGFRLV
ncbi:MAG: hypothetical protein U1E59_21090 [Amaricoccus sp.]